jgi:hypothetical protein
VLSRLIRFLVWAFPLAASGNPCGGSSSLSSDVHALGGPTVSMQFTRATFFDAPFPSDDLLNADGTVAIDGFPNPAENPLVDQLKGLARTTGGFAEEGAAYFWLPQGLPDASALPSMAASITPQASVFLIGVQQGSPDYLQRIPVTVRFETAATPFAPSNLLSLLPLQGTPLRPKTTYAAVVTTAAGLSPSDDMTSLASGSTPSGMSKGVFGEYQAALSTLAQAGVPKASIAGLAVFTTNDPTAQLGTVLADMLSRPLPQLISPLVRTDLFDDYCVYESAIPMPDYQQGAPPYDFATSGGTWVFDRTGTPVLQRHEEAWLVVTIPRAPMPAAGWPIMHFVRTGGGGNRPLVDRGAAGINGGPAIVPGTGPAMFFSLAGFAGASVDGPHEDLRNLTNGNEDDLIFNVSNLPALRDNIRESGAEYFLAALTLDVSDCPGTTSPAKFDATHMGQMGHSMGSTIGPLSLAVEPLYRIAVLSGAGASWIENIMWKQQPFDLLPDVEALLGYAAFHATLKEDDPILTLFQWAEEPADPLVYTRDIITEPPTGMAPRNVLMEQGIVDHYIMPPIANAMSLSLGLDLAGTPLDATSAELQMDGTPTLESVIAYAGRQQIALPASGNRTSQGATLTEVVVQHPADGIEDGHEIVFQTDAPKHEYRCFLETWLAGQTPIIPTAGGPEDPCQ